MGKKDAMPAGEAKGLEGHVLLLASPECRELIVAPLREAGIECDLVAGFESLDIEAARGADVIVMAAAAQTAADELESELRLLVDGSRATVIVLVEGGLPQGALEGFDNVIELDWPLRPASLVSVVRAGLRSRLAAAGSTIDRAALHEGGAASGRSVSDMEQALHASEERYRRLIETAAEGIWEIDLNGRILYANQSMATILGRGGDDLSGCSWIDLVDPDDAPRAREALARVARGDQEHSEWRLRRADGSSVWVSMSTAAIKDHRGRPEGAFAMVTDISDRKRVERELARHRDHLESLVRERTRELEESHQRLRLSERLAALGTLAAGLGHDIGNLLLPIRARLDALRAERLSTSAASQIPPIVKCIDYLQSLSSGLRLLSLDPAHESPGPVWTELASWWASVEMLLRNAVDRRVRIEVDPLDGLPVLAIAPHRLTQTIFNIFKNAGEALGQQPSPRIKLTAESAAAGELVRLRVQDNGAGMTAQTRLRAIEPFYTTKTRSLSTGLGLSLANGIITAAGGELDIESQPGEGTSVMLTIPAAKVHEHSSAGREIVISMRDRRRRTLLMQILQSIGYAVREADEPGDASIWVTEAAPQSLPLASRFLEQGGRAVLVDAEIRGEWDRPGIASLGAPLRPQRLREIIERAAAQSTSIR
jgi:PAS domain S-box-containing protein